MGKAAPTAKEHPFADRRIVDFAGLGDCPRCGRRVGTMGFWLGARRGEGVVCDGCALGWPVPVSVGEGEALRLLMGRGRGDYGG